VVGCKWKIGNGLKIGSVISDLRGRWQVGDVLVTYKSIQSILAMFCVHLNVLSNFEWKWFCSFYDHQPAFQMSARIVQCCSFAKLVLKLSVYAECACTNGAIAPPLRPRQAEGADGA
jgi:hypothetical protein